VAILLVAHTHVDSGTATYKAAQSQCNSILQALDSQGSARIVWLTVGRLALTVGISPHLCRLRERVGHDLVLHPSMTRASKIVGT